MKITKEQAVSIETFLKKCNGNKEILLMLHASKIGSKEGWKSIAYSPINGLSLDQLAKALYVGYEVEYEKNEKIIKLFERLNHDRENSMSPMVRMISEKKIKDLLEVLDILEVKIEGIN